MYMAIKSVVIDAGHGGADNGASGNGIIEKNLTLDISKYMYDRFKELGVPVKMTRTSDVDLDANARPKVVLDQYGTGKDVIVLSNHINAGGGDNPSGKLTFFENLYNNLPKYGIMITEKAVFNL